MRKIKITTPTPTEGGYISRTISKGMLNTAPVSAWTQFFHKPYAFDWLEARSKALDHINHSPYVADSMVKTEH